MQGRRIADRINDNSLEGIEPGDYWKDGDGVWWASVPGKHPEGDEGCILACMVKHTCTEHEDGTLTVSPSILVSSPWGPSRVVFEFYHGFLERGVWRSC
jgi:hypothetical protein